MGLFLCRLKMNVVLTIYQSRLNEGLTQRPYTEYSTVEIFVSYHWTLTYFGSQVAAISSTNVQIVSSCWQNYLSSKIAHQQTNQLTNQAIDLWPGHDSKTINIIFQSYILPTENPTEWTLSLGILWHNVFKSTNPISSVFDWVVTHVGVAKNNTMKSSTITAIYGDNKKGEKKYNTNPNTQRKWSTEMKKKRFHNQWHTFKSCHFFPFALCMYSKSISENRE